MAASIGLIVVAAGSSRRMGNVDKIWADLGGKPVVSHSLDTLAPVCTSVVLVVRPECVDFAKTMAWTGRHRPIVVPGGRTRAESVLAGIRTLENVTLIAVHDGARPFATAGLLREGRRYLETYEAAIPVVPMVDTIKRVGEGGRVLQTVARDDLFAAQTPQIFRSESMRDAHESYHDFAPVTDDASLMEAAGKTVATFPGDPNNFKLTTARDLWLARIIVAGGDVPRCE